MKTKTSIRDWKRIYDELNNPELIEEKMLQNQIRQDLSNKKKDTGIC